MITNYEILKVSPNASLAVITESYNALCKKYNPDNYQDEIKRAKAESVIKRLNEAFEVLSDKKKRYDYDLKLKFIEDTDVILKDEKISSEIKQTDTNEGVLKKINFGKIKENISQSVDNIKTEIKHSINENITSKVDLKKVKGDIAKSVENAKTLSEKIENSVHEKIENIDFDAIKSDIKDKIHTLDSNAEKKIKKDTEIDDDFYQKITTETEGIDSNQNHHSETQKSKFSFAVIRIFVLLFSVLIYNNFDYLKSFIIFRDDIVFTKSDVDKLKNDIIQGYLKTTKHPFNGNLKWTIIKDPYIKRYQLGTVTTHTINDKIFTFERPVLAIKYQVTFVAKSIFNGQDLGTASITTPWSTEVLDTNGNVSFVDMSFSYNSTTDYYVTADEYIPKGCDFKALTQKQLHGIDNFIP
jgi:curved DNA-binding protein CbpA